jgi:hypothetical protein
MSKCQRLIYIVVLLPTMLGVESPAQTKPLAISGGVTQDCLTDTTIQCKKYLQYAQNSRGKTRRVNPNNRGGAASYTPPSSPKVARARAAAAVPSKSSRRQVGTGNNVANQLNRQELERLSGATAAGSSVPAAEGVTGVAPP